MTHRHRERPRKLQPTPIDHNTLLHDVRMKLDYLPLADIQPALHRVRNHNKKKIGEMAASIRRLGCLSPIIIGWDGRIIDGHAVVEACREAELTEVPVVRHEHLSEAEAIAAKLALNSFSLKGTWDWEMVALDLQQLDSPEVDFSLQITGFDTPKIDWIINQAKGSEGPVAEDDDTIDPEGPAITRPGDLYQIGSHRLICGDARCPETFARLMQGEKARMVFCDGPYNVEIAGFVSGLGRKTHREFAMASGEMTKDEFTCFQSEVNAHLVAHSLDGSVHYLCTDFRHLREMLDAGESAYSQLLNMLVWDKTSGGMGGLYRSAHELIFVWKAGTGSIVNNIELGKHGRYRTNILEYPGFSQFSHEREEALSIHPTSKPVALVYDVILDVSHRGNIVLDPFSGSGSTLLAAERAGRKGYAIEIDPLYVDASLKRIEKRTGLKAILVETGESFEEVATRRAAEVSVAEGLREAS